MACAGNAADAGTADGAGSAGMPSATAGSVGVAGAGALDSGGSSGEVGAPASGAGGATETGEAGAPSDAGAGGAPSEEDTPPVGWNLVWGDEFDGVKGTPLDKAKWKYSVSGNNANNELEYYTDRPENSGTDGEGHFFITARKETYKGRNYTSAKFISAGIFQRRYGRFEARLQLPAGKGLWPAFWALGSNIGDVRWPNCGEIDIMETMGSQLTINRGSLHGPGYSGGNPLTAQFHLQGGSDFSKAFHVFAAEWEENVVRFYVDDQLYETRTPKDLNGKRWVYDHDFYMILNVAVGGTFPGAPDNSVFPQTMWIDYVRVYGR